MRTNHRPLSKIRAAVNLGAALTALTFSVHAYARSASAWSGAPHSDATTCFTEAYGAVTNTCSSSKTWEIGLPIDSSGLHGATVSVTTSSVANSVSCQLFGMAADGSSPSASSVVYAPTPSAAQNISFPNVTVPTNGYLFVNCYVLHGASVNSVIW